MVGSSFLFSSMGVCVKLSAAEYGLGEIVMARGITGVVLIALLARWRGVSLRTRVPMMHAWRGVVGVAALTLWFYAMAHLPLATAVTLNYMSSVWMALFLIGGAVLVGGDRVDPRLVALVLLGFGGVALVLHPTLEKDQLAAGVIGLASGMLSAMAYLQVTTLGRAGEPELRVVFYFSLASALTGAGMTAFEGHHPITPHGLVLLVATGLLATTAQVLLTRAYAIGRALSNASLNYLGIAFSFVYGVFLFHDAMTWSATAGIVLIVAAGLGSTLLRANVVPRQPSDTLSPPNET